MADSPVDIRKSQILINAKGGLNLVIEGVITELPREKEKKDAKGVVVSVSHTINVEYVGGSCYLTLADPGQIRHFKLDAVLRLEAKAKSFKDNMYPGPAILTHVDGKPVPQL